MSVIRELGNSYTTDLRFILTGIGFGVATGLLGKKVSDKIHSTILPRIVTQLIILITVYHFIRTYAPKLIEGDVDGNFHQFYYGVQVFLFFDLARFFNMTI